MTTRLTGNESSGERVIVIQRNLIEVLKEQNAQLEAQNARLLRYINRLENWIIDVGVVTSIVEMDDIFRHERDAAGLQDGDIPDD